MRSLVPLEAIWHPIDRSSLTPTKSRVTAHAIDPDAPPGKGYYVCLEAAYANGGVEVLIVNDDTDQVVARFASDIAPPSNLVGWHDAEESDLRPAHVVLLSFRAELGGAIVALAGGDLINVPFDGSDVDIVGSVESGLSAAAWSPDEELLAVVTGEQKLVVFTRDYDVLADQELVTQDFGEAMPVDVGWGSKQTQFHGSVGKTAAKEVAHSQISAVDWLSPNDDKLPRISWRGDGAFFAVSSLESFAAADATTGQRRRIRIYSRTGALQSTTEPTPRLEHSLAWQPSGSIIASTQYDRENGEDDVIFFERNGLRRYDFALRHQKAQQAYVHNMFWNCDSTLLAVWLRSLSGDCVQLWYRNNYYWYLKSEVAAPQHERLANVAWHAESANELVMLTQDASHRRTFTWEVLRGRATPSIDPGSVAVIDGSRLLLTPFRYMQVPPPMSAFQLGASAPISHAVISHEHSLIALLTSERTCELWQWQSRNSTSMATPVQLLSQKLETIPDDSVPLQLALSSDGPADVHITVLLARPRSITSLVTISYDLQRNVCAPARLSESQSRLIKIASANDSVLQHYANGQALIGTLDIRLPESCHELDVFEHCVIGLSSRSVLYANGRKVATNVSSFTRCGAYLIYTTRTHEAHFVLLQSLHDPSQEAGYSETLPEAKVMRQEDSTAALKLKVERGSHIVCAVAATMTLVLQMPRGNIESVCPRPLVLQSVRYDLSTGSLRNAFMSCRKHRIDLNILIDMDAARFMTALEDWVAVLPDPDHLNLLLSSLVEDNVVTSKYAHFAAAHNISPLEDKVNVICEGLRQSLITGKGANEAYGQYLTTILTSFVCQRPPRYEEALLLLKSLQATRTEAEIEAAIKYMIFLSDANKLYDIALGTYDLELTLLIAQQSQKDPREYLPFLRELRKAAPAMRAHKIEDTLQHYSDALQHLTECTLPYDEVETYIRRHELYDEAVKYYANDANTLPRVLQTRAVWQLANGAWLGAAMSFRLAGDMQSAMHAYQDALAWRELFTLALELRKGEKEIRELAQHMSESLKARNRHAEAARVLLEYSRDPVAAVKCSCEGRDYIEAIRIAYLYGRSSLLSSHVFESMEETARRVDEEIQELQAQIKKQLGRLAELEIIKAENPSKYYGAFEVEDGALEGVDIASEAGSTIASQFTRYTAVASSQVSTASGKTGRSKRKDAKKKAAGQRGGIFEHHYLVGSISRSTNERLPALRDEATMLIPLLYTYASAEPRRRMRELGSDLQVSLTSLEEEIRTAIVTVWGPPEREREDTTVKDVPRPSEPANSRSWSAALVAFK
ncbi:uncharacterized protein L969DRAFT_42814 [Mixia osmundae IAM 14324]|uniref:Elongator complex protein 1 n=1 Tax=Mixia osmundae (strain CBS 9802 / IAM 14324 / JCM 22182 / KY 12970) TaxID=764103 RepID=G7E3U6_MIXOS|nr:uncharacterized protein L969DRAFT_42814 [Mixia osmundae IAM 14324]KEI41951.1 hypothetical protein L969DRAFT_42814 [Mixia osmundae IAM 14324]GAA97506.1 hypothetical protein E5Q_04184 [Mixia osmundae IAM 14324]